MGKKAFMLSGPATRKVKLHNLIPLIEFKVIINSVVNDSTGSNLVLFF